MFSLLHRQYDGLGELIRALPKAYAINAVSYQDTMDLLECLGQIRSLLIVQMGPEEERLMIQSIGSECFVCTWSTSKSKAQKSRPKAFFNDGETCYINGNNNIGISIA